MKYCEQCRQQNPDDANFCHQCGAALSTAQSQSETASNSAAYPEADLWRAFIGPNADRYLEQFKKFTTGGTPRFTLTWNWPAFLFVSFLWFLYRKMYVYAFIYAVGPMISTYLTGDITVGIVWSIMAGVSANYIYYWHCREHVGEIKKKHWSTQQAQELALKDAGGTQPYVIWVGVAFYLLFVATLVKMVQEGPPDSDRPAGPTRSTATGSV